MAAWVYRTLLRLYPRELRQRFGDEMLAFFRVRHGAAAERGAAALARFWCATLIDLVVSAWSARAAARSEWNLSAAAGRLVSETRDAWRSLRRAPASSAGIALLLGVAIGAATAVFGVVNAVLLRPLPFADSDRIVAVWETRPGRGVDRNAVSGHEFPMWVERSQSFERMAAMTYAAMTLTGAGEPQALAVVRVTSAFCDVMGTSPAIGRGFLPADDEPGRGQVAIVSHRLWREAFNADPHLPGRAIRLDGRAFVVVGVMPAGFRFPRVAAGRDPDIWVPIAEPIHLYRGRHYLSVVARLRPGLTLARADDEMRRVSAEIERELPGLNTDHSARIVRLQDEIVRDARSSLVLLFAAVAALVLIGCSNAAALLAARGIARRGEIATRLALGASRMSVLRQLVIEGLLLAAGGLALALAIASVLADAAPVFVPPDVVKLDAVPLDFTVLAFAAAAGLGTAVLFGAAPAFQLRRVDVTSALRGSARMPAIDGRLRRTLVVGQIALTMMLALAAGLTARSLSTLQSIDPGFSTTGLLAVDVGLPGSRYSGPIAQRQFFADLTARMRGLPGVESVAATNMTPLGGAFSGIAIAIEGEPPPAEGQEPSARHRVVSADYFSALRVPVRAGRTFSESDARVAVPLLRWFPQQPMPAGHDAPQPRPVAVINERMAAAFWPGRDPIGREFRALFSPPIAVIGVVADVRDESIRSAPRPEFYLHDLQEPQAEMTMLVRTGLEAAAAAPALKGAIWGLDRDLAVREVRTLDSVRDREIGRPRFTSRLLGAFGALALLLMAAGVYGLFAFTTSQRLPEIGLRVALGAHRAAIVRMIAGQALALTLTGLSIGGIGAALLARLLRAELPGVETLDLTAWLGVAAVVTGVGLASCWLPARRAARTDPAAVLRQG